MNKLPHRDTGVLPRLAQRIAWLLLLWRRRIDAGRALTVSWYWAAVGGFCCNNGFCYSDIGFASTSTAYVSSLSYRSCILKAFPCCVCAMQLRTYPVLILCLVAYEYRCFSLPVIISFFFATVDTPSYQRSKTGSGANGCEL